MKKVSIIFLSFLGLALASTAIAIVWIRLQISDSAKICGRLEDERESGNERGSGTKRSAFLGTKTFSLGIYGVW